MLYIPAGKDTALERERFLTELRQFFGAETEVTLEVTGSLCRQKSGKFQLVRKEE